MNSLRDAMKKTSVNLITLDYSNVETYKIGQKGLGIKMDGEKFTNKFLRRKFYEENFTKKTLRRKFYEENFTKKILRTNFYEENFTKKILRRKFYEENFTKNNFEGSGQFPWSHRSAACIYGAGFL